MSDYIRKLRQKVGQDILLLPAVSVAIFDDQKRLLLLRHSEGNVWVLPGGAVDVEEVPANAARREVFEETGMIVEPTAIMGVYGGPDFTITYGNGDSVSYVMTLFSGAVIEGSPRPDGIESLEISFFSLSEALTLSVPRWMASLVPSIFYWEGKATFQSDRRI